MKNKWVSLLGILGILLLGGCAERKSPSGEIVSETLTRREVEVVEYDDTVEQENYNLIIEPEEKQKIEKEAVQVALLYKTIYKAADKGESYNVVISEEIVEEIKECLARKNKVVIDDAGHFNMANSKLAQVFCEAALSGEEAEVTIYELHRNGGYSRLDFHVKNKQMDLMVVSVGWNESIEPQVTYMEKYQLKNWQYTDKGYLIYERYFSPFIECSGYSILRVRPLKEEYLELTNAYIRPIGYQGNNLFLANWNKEDMTPIAFNNVFEYFYYLTKGESINVERYKKGIPELEFETILCTYLPITGEELKKFAYYDQQTKYYKWQVLGCANYTATPKGYPVPEVIDCIRNKDGSITLTVDALWEEYGTDCAFTHEVTIVPQSDGNFYYIGNSIQPKGNQIIPVYRNRIKID